MSIMGTWRDGKIHFDVEPSWQDGERLRIETDDDESAAHAPELLGDDPESIKRWLAEFDSLPRLIMTPEEHARWEADREVMKQYSIKKMLERSDAWP